MRNNLLAAALCGALAVVNGAPGSAHISNEKSLFSDIAGSDARFDIVMLSALDMIPDAEAFEPRRPLTLQQLEAWMSQGEGHGQGRGEEETAEADAADEDAASAESRATIADIDEIIFEGGLGSDRSDETLSRGEAAQFVASKLAETGAGQSLLSQKEAELGPKGQASVESKPSANGGTIAYVTVGDVTAPFYAHGKVANGPTDLSLWNGQEVERSLLRNTENGPIWIYLEAAEAIPAGEHGGEDREHHDD